MTISIINYINNYLIAPMKDRWFPDLEAQIREIPAIYQHRKDFFSIAKEHDLMNFYTGWKEQDRADPHWLKILRVGDKILTGPVKRRCNPELLKGSSLLAENLRYSKWLMRWVLNRVPHSRNYMSRTFREEDPNWSHLGMEMNSFRVQMKSRTLLQLAKNIVTSGHGVCENLALVGLIHSWQTHPEKPVEWVHCYEGKHHLLIIGREKGSSPKDHRTWGKDCVFCDIWAGKCFSVSQIEQELYTYIGDFYSFSKKITFPLVRPFNAQIHKVAVLHEQTPENIQKFLGTSENNQI